MNGAAGTAGAVRGAVAAGGRRLEYEWIGPGPAAAPTLVFLHDGLGCVDTWRDFPAALAAAAGCGALLYSRAGYGGSEPLPGPWPATFMHDEARTALPDLVAALGVRDGFLVGHSDGASIALIYAALHPGALHAGTLVARAAAPARAVDPGAVPGAAAAPPGTAPGESDAPAAPAGWLRGLALEAPHVFVEPVAIESIAKLPGLYRQPDLWRRMVRHHGANAEACFESWVAAWLSPEFRAWDIRELLPAVRCPVLAIQGDRDAYGTLEQLRLLAAGCSGPTETLILPGCGHTPHRQQREPTLHAMTAFLRRLL